MKDNYNKRKSGDNSDDSLDVLLNNFCKEYRNLEWLYCFVDNKKSRNREILINNIINFISREFEKKFSSIDNDLKKILGLYEGDLKIKYHNFLEKNKKNEERKERFCDDIINYLEEKNDKYQQYQQKKSRIIELLDSDKIRKIIEKIIKKNSKLIINNRELYIKNEFVCILDHLIRNLLNSSYSSPLPSKWSKDADNFLNFFLWINENLKRISLHNSIIKNSIIFENSCELRKSEENENNNNKLDETKKNIIILFNDILNIKKEPYFTDKIDKSKDARNIFVYSKMENLQLEDYDTDIDTDKEDIDINLNSKRKEKSIEKRIKEIEDNFKKILNLIENEIEIYYYELNKIQEKEMEEENINIRKEEIEIFKNTLDILIFRQRF